MFNSIKPIKMKEKEVTFEEVFYEKYPLSFNLVSIFRETNGVNASWNNFTKPNLKRFVDAMLSRFAKSSVKTYCAMFKSVLNLYSDEVEIPKGYAEILSVKKDVSENVFLCDEEIKKIISYVPDNETEHIIKNQFILGLLSGARHSDYVTLTKMNIQDGRLVYISKKTHIRSEIPLSKTIERIITENEQMGYVGRIYSDPTFNKTIRDICRKCGIDEETRLYNGGKYQSGKKYEFVASHTARRSFATNLYLRGADLYSISKLMGHSSVTMTEGYISCGLRNLPQSVLDYFNEI